MNLVRLVLKFYMHDYSTKNIRIFYTGKDSKALETKEFLNCRHQIHPRRPNVDDEIVEVTLTSHTAALMSKTNLIFLFLSFAFPAYPRSRGRQTKH